MTVSSQDPRFYHVLQMSCVSCREEFGLPQEASSARTRAPFADTSAPIPCPRCGADNREWARVLHPAMPNRTRLPTALQILTDSYFVTLATFLVPLGMAAVSVAAALRGGHNFWFHTLPLLLSLFGSAGAILWLTVSQWRQTWEEARLCQYLPDLAEWFPFAPTIRIASLPILLFALAAPLLLWYVAPWQDVLPSSSRRFFFEWISLVGGTDVLLLIVAISAVRAFISRLGRQLPPPIYRNVASMTGIVTWEAKRLLDINGWQMEQIQWMSIERNEWGGVDLVGLYRDAPEFEENGRYQPETVRAQRYEISSDMWGHIKVATVRDVAVPRSAVSPSYVMHALDVDAPLEREAYFPR